MSNIQYPDSWIQTFSGRKFYLLDPRPDDVNIIDIAHSLSMQCRYTGHSNRFFSVAEHSLLVASKTGLHGLLHDAAEAYIGDMSRPLKRTPFAQWYRDLEDLILAAIYIGLGLQLPTLDEHILIKEADDRVLATEKLVLHHEGHPWNLLSPYTDMKIWCHPPTFARDLFLREWELLSAK